MIAKEKLMLGDWVLHHGCYYVVAELLEDYVTLDNGEDEIAAEYNEIEPIKLSDGIFRKNNFSRSEFNFRRSEFRETSYQWESNDGTICIRIWRNCKYPATIIMENKWYVLPNPSSVHELQHNLKIVGSDKEIIL